MRCFYATVGGLGLTGVIAWVEFQAVRIPSFHALDAEDVEFEHVSDYFSIVAEKKDRFEHTMAWIDCLAGGAHLVPAACCRRRTGMPMAISSRIARTRS